MPVALALVRGLPSCLGCTLEADTDNGSHLRLHPHLHPPVFPWRVAGRIRLCIPDQWRNVPLDCSNRSQTLQCLLEFCHGMEHGGRL